MTAFHLRRLLGTGRQPEVRSAGAVPRWGGAALVMPRPRCAVPPMPNQSSAFLVLLSLVVMAIILGVAALLAA